jgi:hypothetical protein
MPHDYTARLGFASMPPGYLLIGLDSGHFIYERQSDEAESAIHWDKWAVRRWAWEDYRSLNPQAPAGAER